MAKHEHEWRIIVPKVIGEFQKGNRGMSYSIGDYEACRECPSGRFVPYQKGQRIVECEMVVSHVS